MKKYFLIVLALALSGCTPLWEANRYGRYKFYEGIEEGAKKGFIEGYKKGKIDCERKFTQNER